MAPEIIGAGIGALGSLLGASYSQDYNRENMGLQAKSAKELAQYQWDNFSSPAAQVRALNKVGLGVNAFVGGKGQAAQPSMNMPSSAPIQVDGIADLGAISQYILSVAQAKKAGMDTSLAEQEIKNKQVQQQADEFKLNLAKKYGDDEMASKVASAYMNLVLSADQSDLNEIEKNIKHYEEITSQYVSQIKESERDIAQQELENNPTLIRLKNRLVKNQGSAAAASAEASHAAAEESRSQVLINRELRRQEAIKALIKEKSAPDEFKKLIDEYRKDRMISHQEYQDALVHYNDLLQRSTARERSNFVNKVDAAFNWLGEILGTPLKGLK